MILNNLYTYNMSERIKDIDDTVNKISTTLWIIIVVFVIIIMFIFVFCSYNETAKQIISSIWNRYLEKISMVWLLVAIIWIIWDIKIILKHIKNKLWKK